MVKHLSHKARQATRKQLHSHQKKNNGGGLCSFNNLMKVFFLILIVLMNLLCVQYWNQVQEMRELEHIINAPAESANDHQPLPGKKSNEQKTPSAGALRSDDKGTASGSSAFSGKVETKLATTIKSGKVEIGTTSSSTNNNNNNNKNPFPKSISRSKDLTCDAYTPSFLPQSQAKEIIINYAKEVVALSQRPRFVPLLLELMKATAGNKTMLLTVQLGGMDGYTGDPFFRMTKLFKEPLTHWLPVVVEPVPQNFEKLVGTYQHHKQNRQLPCGHLLQQLVNYDPKQEASQKGICGFCRFDETSTKCDDVPSWQKYQIGSMECGREVNKQCFVRSEFLCGRIAEAMENVHVHPSQVAVLQIDVEGFERQTLEGFFDEISPSDYPPAINFENKILKRRKQLEPLYKLLRSKGYSLHEKPTDTLCLLGYKGDTFLDTK
jgi:hypothetical protein